MVDPFVELTAPLIAEHYVRVAGAVDRWLEAPQHDAAEFCEVASGWPCLSPEHRHALRQDVTSAFAEGVPDLAEKSRAWCRFVAATASWEPARPRFGRPGPRQSS